MNLTAAGAVGGSFWGMLIGMLFLNPLAGAAIGAGAVAFSEPHEDDAGKIYDGSFSILHEATGLNFTTSGGLKEQDNQDDQNNAYVKAGWLTELFPVGNTGFSVDYTKSNNFPNEDADGWSMGGALVQQFGDYGTEIFATYRYYTLDIGNSEDLHPINLFGIGSRVKF